MQEGPSEIDSLETYRAEPVTPAHLPSLRAVQTFPTGYLKARPQDAKMNSSGVVNLGSSGLDTDENYSIV